MKKKVIGNFPEFCFRAFDKLKYAKKFIENGSFRLNNIKTYPKIKCKSRRDSYEGIGIIKEFGIWPAYSFSSDPKEKTIIENKKYHRKSEISLHNNVFILSTSLPHVSLDYISNKFGPFIVKIIKPKFLANEINDYLFRNKLSYLIEGHKIKYNKGKKIHSSMTNNERLDLSYTQKSRFFLKECEFRISAINLSNNSKNKFLEINLNKKLNYKLIVKHNNKKRPRI